MHQITLQHGENTTTINISLEMFQRIKREITRSLSVDGVHSTDDLIERMLRDKQWDNISEFDTKVLAPVLEAFNGVDVDPQQFPRFVASLGKSSNKIRQHLLGSQGTTHGLYDLMSEEFHNIFTNSQQAHVLFDAIYNITPTGIGRGEIILTLTSDAVKGDRGDLCFDNLGDIDVKGDGGRLGGDGFAADRTPIMVENILQNIGVSTRHTVLNRACDRLLNVALKYPHLQHLQNIITHRAFGDHLEVFNNVPGVPKRVATTIKRGAHQAAKLIANQRTMSFADTIATFFSNVHLLSYNQFIDGVTMMRSYHMREHTEELHNALQQLIVASEQQEFKHTSKYLPLVAALHLVCYVVVEGRKGVVFLNDHNKNAISFRTQHNIHNDLMAAYDLFTRHDFKLRASIDHRGKTISVKFNE